MLHLRVAPARCVCPADVRAAPPGSLSHAVPAFPRSSFRKHLHSVRETRGFRTLHILSVERANTPSFLQGLHQARRRTPSFNGAVAAGSFFCWLLFRVHVGRPAALFWHAIACPFSGSTQAPICAQIASRLKSRNLLPLIARETPLLPQRCNSSCLFRNQSSSAIASESKCDSKDTGRQRQRCRPY